MLIGFDIDDTIGDCLTPSFNYLNGKFGRKHTPESVARWIKTGNFNPKDDLFAQLYGVTSADITAIYDSESMNVYPFMSAFPKAIVELNRLVAEGHTIVYITARREHWRSVTEWWLWGIGAPRGEVYFTYQKAELSTKLGVKKFYEDNVKNIVSLIGVGVECTIVDSLQNNWIELDGVERVYWNDKHTAIKLALTKDDVTVS